MSPPDRTAPGEQCIHGVTYFPVKGQIVFSALRPNQLPTRLLDPVVGVQKLAEMSTCMGVAVSNTTLLRKQVAGWIWLVGHRALTFALGHSYDPEAVNSGLHNKLTKLAKCKLVLIPEK